MLWFILIAVILVGIFAKFGDLLEYMKESRFEFLRILYWLFVIALFTLIIGWMFTWSF